MSELQRRLATAELHSALSESQRIPKGWMAFLAPRIGSQEGFYRDLTDLVSDYRADVWPTNRELVDQRFDGDDVVAKEKIRQHFRDEEVRSSMLTDFSGNGSHILSTGLLVYAPGNEVGSLNSFEHPDQIDAIQLVGVDISGTPLQRLAKHAMNITSIGPKDKKAKVYTTLYGGLEARAGMEDSDFENLAIDSLNMVSRGVLRDRTQTLYLSSQVIEQRAENVYQRHGFSVYGSAPYDDVFGSIQVLRRHP